MELKVTLCLFLCVCSVYNLKLEQVLIFSRHNIRQPLTENLQQFGLDIERTSRYKAGDLTAKGAVLEEYMGEYIVNWLRKKALLTNDCPDKNMVYVYANTRQRTKETAKAFVKGAFRDCDVEVFSIDSDEMDPIFNPIFRNTSQQMKEIITEEMKNNLNKLDIQDSYMALDKMINLTDTSICKEKGFCSFENSSNDVFYEIGKEPDVIGPLRYGNSIVDAYLMAYYEGSPMESIAKGQLKSVERLDLLGKITHANQIVRFHSSNLAREVAKPLLNYIYDSLNGEKKLILMVGHDSNIQSLLAALEFKDFVLPEQIENTPIGGKLVFQKWNDEDTDQKLVNISYIYPSTQQIRDGIQLSENNPPQWVHLVLSTCPTNLNGFIAWKCFIALLRNVK